MNNSPWLNSETVRLAHDIASSYNRAFKKQLVSSKSFSNRSSTFSQELFIMNAPVLAHDISNDPLFIYANSAALNLWKLSWSEMIGMPSRLSAPADQVEDRLLHIKKAFTEDFLQLNGTVRVDRLGRKFFIKNVRIWTIFNNQGSVSGQAATFSSWWFI